MIILSQLKKYEFENKLISNQAKTFTILNLICCYNFVSSPLLKFYQLDEYRGSRKGYQAKKDYFCLWVLNIILNECQRKSADALHNAALYILTFMSILKHLRK